MKNIKMFYSKNVQTLLRAMIAVRSEKGVWMLNFLDGNTTTQQIKESEKLGEIIYTEDD